MRNKRGYYDAFVRTCARYPSKIAVRNYEDGVFKNYTYSELYGVCEYISQNLQQLQCSKSIIGVILERNIIVPCVVAAIHKFYTTFMFLDPNADNSQILNTIKFGTIITVGPSESITYFVNKVPDKSIEVFGLMINIYKIDKNTSVEDTTYVNEYSFIALTSGSTGAPKQIQVPIQCIQPNVDDLTKLFHITPEDVIYFSTPLTFDPSMIEILLACMNAASLLIAPEQADILFSDQESSVTFWQTTPSKFFQFSDTDISTKILGAESHLRVLALGGEPLNSVKLLKELKAIENTTKIYTMYGVTEMSCWACVAELDLDKVENDVPLGVCLSETELKLQSSSDNKSIGNIMLGSQSRQCIIINKPVYPEIDPMKWIDTGDIGEYKNGSIYYRGRRDNIIKRFGHKINLQKIESTVMKCDKIKSCSCIWLPKPMMLVMYFTSHIFSSKELAKYLKNKLDDRHWPDQIIRIDSMPVNKHGKISKILLTKMFTERKKPPLDYKKTEIIFLNELQKTLNIHFSYDDLLDKNFFSLGGTSFIAVSLCNKLSMMHSLFRKLLPHLLSQKSIKDVLCDLKADIDYESFPKSPKKLKRRKLSSEQSCRVQKNSGNSFLNNPNNPIELSIQWSYDTGRCVDASPVIFKSIDNLFVTVGSHSGKVVVLEAFKGYLQGEIKMKSRIEASVFCYHDNRVPGQAYGVVGTYDGTILCYILQTCTEVWRINVNSMIKSKATCYNECLYVASYDGAVRCINILTGTIIKVIPICDQPISADLILAKNEYVLVGTLSGVCTCIHVDNHSILWQEKLGSPVFASPVIYDKGRFVIFVEVTGVIHCRSVERGIKMWRYDGAKGNIFSSVLIKEIEPAKWEMVFGCHDNNVYCVEIFKFHPSLHWKAQMPSPVYSTPCTLYENSIIAASSNGSIYIIDSKNGSLLVEHKLPDDIFSSPVVYNDYIFIGCRNDHLYALKYKANEPNTLQ